MRPATPTACGLIWAVSECSRLALERLMQGFRNPACRAKLRIRSRAAARTRTGDPFITSEVLYQLSYGGSAGIVASAQVRGAAHR